jgi:hypothetical protein
MKLEDIETLERRVCEKVGIEDISFGEFFDETGARFNLFGNSHVAREYGTWTGQIIEWLAAKGLFRINVYGLDFACVIWEYLNLNELSKGKGLPLAICLAVDAIEV